MAALILDDGLYDLYAAFTAGSPAFFRAGSIRVAMTARAGRRAPTGCFDIGAAGAAERMLGHGARSHADLIRKTEH